jgi:hypothetical protein
VKRKAAQPATDAGRAVPIVFEVLLRRRHNMISGSRFAAVGAALALVGALFLHGDTSRAAHKPNVDPSCSSPSPCIQYDNTSTGAGIKGTSTAGNGVAGTTFFNSTTISNGTAGVTGADSSTTGAFDKGVFGTTKIGAGVKGTAVSGVGLWGKVTGAGTAVRAETSNDNATLFDGKDAAGTHVLRVDSFGDEFLSGALFGGQSFNSVEGVDGEGTQEGTIGQGLTSSGTDLYATGVAGALILDGVNSGNVQVLKVDDSGNETITGLIFTAGGCSSGCVNAHQPGTRVISYMPREAEPTMEDVGEGQLVNGRGYVSIASDFASVVDRTRQYFVFLTPNGDSRGLYVSDRSPTGFTVRENGNGRSTLSFDYRIVAKPYGESMPRLPRANFAAQPKLMRLSGLGNP